MAYNYYPYQPNYFGNPYQAMQPAPVQQSYQQPPQQQSVQQSSAILWVNGEREAELYPVAPNNAVALWDSSNPSIYLKKADASGKPTITIYDLVERSGAVKNDAQAIYATKDDVDALKAEIKRMQGDLYGVAGKRKKAVEEDE